MHELPTERLVLRGWKESDREPFAELGADPEVMRHFPAALSREQSDAAVDRWQAGLDERGWGVWAVEGPGGVFAGAVGLAPLRFEAHFAPGVEILWRLARSAWGRGYATEAASAVLGFAAAHLGPGTPYGLEEVVSFTVPANRRSRAVMERIGMVHDSGGGFDHPRLPEGHPLRRHVLYRVPLAGRG
ncbi:GNAT family N-acetyltransferase [Nocardiopsis coralliicola]